MTNIEMDFTDDILPTEPDLPRQKAPTRISKRSSAKNGAKKPRPGQGGRERMEVLVHPDQKQRAKYWADKYDLSTSEYVAEALDEKIARENGDYDLPTLEQARLAQLVDEHRALTTAVANLQRMIITQSETIIGLTRGDSYLNDAEDGELGDVA